MIHGLRVFAGNGLLRGLCKEQRIDEVLISSSRFSEERLAEIYRDCEEEQVSLKQMRIRIEKVDSESLRFQDF